MNQKLKLSKIKLICLCLSAAIGFEALINVLPSKAQISNPIASATPPPLPERDDEILTIDTELVNLYVQVVDRFNRPIANLREKDFQVFEDKVKQTIQFFSQAEVPTNYALVIDNSGSLRFQLEKVIEASKTIVKTNRPNDETGVIRFVSSDKIEILQDFTSDKTDLNDALDNMYVEGGRTAIIDAVYLAAKKIDEYKRSVSAADRKRRALILVSDGEDRNSYYKKRQLFKLLQETDVQIYTIGFIDDLEGKSSRKKAKNFLSKLAAETGGKFYFPKSVAELPKIARDIARELRTQYLISYLPTNTKKDGTLRNIKVSVMNGPRRQKRIARYKTNRVAKPD